MVSGSERHNKATRHMREGMLSQLTTQLCKLLRRLSIAEILRSRRMQGRHQPSQTGGGFLGAFHTHFKILPEDPQPKRNIDFDEKWGGGGKSPVMQPLEVRTQFFAPFFKKLVQLTTVYSILKFKLEDRCSF